MVKIPIIFKNSGQVIGCKIKSKSYFCQKCSFTDCSFSEEELANALIENSYCQEVKKQLCEKIPCYKLKNQIQTG